VDCGSWTSGYVVYLSYGLKVAAFATIGTLESEYIYSSLYVKGERRALLIGRALC
jgi:hypothetical protein